MEVEERMGNSTFEGLRELVEDPERTRGSAWLVLGAGGWEGVAGRRQKALKGRWEVLQE